jgi:branched-chain amino acid transport system ATP-binding protein
MTAEAFFQIHHLTKRFGGLVAINDFSMEIRSGEILGLIGPNGAGKTTLFNCINKFYDPEAGQILMEGKDLARVKPHQVAELGIGRTFQNIELFGNLTVRENLLIGQHRRIQSGFFSGAFSLKRYRKEEQEVQEKAEEVCANLGLSGIKNAPVSGLPLGTRKLVELARALVSQPKLLLLDEPVAGMNPTESDTLAKVIREVRQKLGITVFLIEHDMGLVMRICSRLYVIHYGSKIAEGTPEEIRNNPLVIEAYLGQEAGLVPES